MANRPRPATGLRDLQSYLEEEFPTQVQASSENVMTVSHDGIRHDVILEADFLKQCPDYAYALRESELADYIREDRSQGRRFLVIWREQKTRIRSSLL